MTPRWIVGLAALALALAGCGSKEARCTGSADCPLGAVCAAGTCQARTCAADRECDLGAVCEDGACAAGCRDGLDCPPAQPICVGGGGAVGTCAACGGDADCPAGHTCVERQCRQACRDDGNCQSGHCDPEARWCVDCTADEHCGPGAVCVDQSCVAGCADDASCPIDRPRCVADRGEHGACVQCRGSADCLVGTCRADGTCGAAEPPDAGADAPDAGADRPDAGVDRADAGAPSAYGLDVLFVVDNSSNMAEEQAALIQAFPSFIAELERLVGRRPDLHIGVVSTDLGTGSEIFTACPGTGDGGALQRGVTGTGCVAPTEPYLRDVAAGSGRDTNYTGSLGAAFSCIADLGTEGCFYEQPLAALTRALDGTVAGNAGFLRPDAALAVIVLSDEDDCSATSSGLFSLFTAIGPLDSFRCFAQGVRCAPDEPRVLGAKSACAPRPGSAYLALPSHYADLLRQHKPDGRVAAAVLAGPATPVAVGGAEGAERLEASCTRSGDTVGAAPGIRLAAFAGGFGARGVVGSACADYAATLRSFAGVAAGLLEQR